MRCVTVAIRIWGSVLVHLIRPLLLAKAVGSELKFSLGRRWRIGATIHVNKQCDSLMWHTCLYLSKNWRKLSAHDMRNRGDKPNRANSVFWHTPTRVLWPCELVETSAKPEMFVESCSLSRQLGDLQSTTQSQSVEVSMRKPVTYSECRLVCHEHECHKGKLRAVESPIGDVVPKI
jgi:hypothetical protein